MTLVIARNSNVCRAALCTFQVPVDNSITHNSAHRHWAQVKVTIKHSNTKSTAQRHTTIGDSVEKGFSQARDKPTKIWEQPRRRNWDGLHHGDKRPTRQHGTRKSREAEQRHADEKRVTPAVVYSS